MESILLVIHAIIALLLIVIVLIQRAEGGALGIGGGSDGIGFAIPVDIAKRVIKEIIETGEVERGFIGISAEKNFRGRGVLVNAVLKNGPGDSAGVKHNDIIRKIDNAQVNEIKDVQKIIGELKPGQIIMLDILRQSKIIQLEVLVSKMSFDLR